jgi:DNA-binding PadR family transcriptional regulator
LELEQKSGGAFRFKHGTLYPILHKLEKEGLISGDWLEEETKRKRKSYRLTSTGRRHLQYQRGEWRHFFDRFFSCIGETER